MSVDNPADVVLLRALACMAGGYFAGALIGAVAEHTIDERLTQLDAQRRALASSTDQTPGVVNPAQTPAISPA